MGDLPRFILLKPVSLKTYVCYERGRELGHVYCRGESVFEPYTKIEIEPAKTSSEKLFHLRFCHSNRYLGRCAHDEWAIAAVSKHPEEDLKKYSCTLFKVSVDVNGRSISMIHFKSGLTVFTENTRLSLGCTRNFTERFNYLDWGELVKIPEHVRFKGHNGKYLRGTWFQDHPYLILDGGNVATDKGEEHVVFLQPDGHYRIKSSHHDRFWNRGGNSWIWADASDDCVDDKNTLFWPVKYGGERTIALRNEGNGHYIMNMSANQDLINAAAPGLKEETKLVVEEHVRERSIYNVNYHLDDARVFDHEPYSVAIASEENYENKEATLTLEAEGDVKISKTFTHTNSFNLGGQVAFTMGVPFVANGDQIKVSAEDSISWAWGQEKTETQHKKASFSIRVPPKNQATATYVATKARCTVPFSYTQKARRFTDGQYLIHHHTDGIFSGVYYYNFRFEAIKLQPL